LGALMIAIAVSAAFYETLHFRHVWALLGVIAVLDIACRSPSSRAAPFSSPTEEYSHVDG
jgi:hypothetical protein